MAKKRKKRKVAWTRILILSVSVIVIFSLLLTGCVKTVSYVIHRNDGFTAEDFTQSKNGFLKINRKGYESEIGVDISSFQQEINWYSVKEMGVDFAMIRIGFRDGSTGELYEDPLGYKNIENATEAKVGVGLYFYSSAIAMDELQEEIDFVLDMAKEYKITYPIAYDMEPLAEGDGRIKDLDVETKTKMAIKFCKEMEKAGYTPMIYGNQDWLMNNIDFNEAKKYPIWLAGYTEAPTIDYKMDMWQYTNEADVDGIAGLVDMNILIRKS